MGKLSIKNRKEVMFLRLNHLPFSLTFSCFKSSKTFEYILPYSISDSYVSSLTILHPPHHILLLPHHISFPKSKISLVLFLSFEPCIPAPHFQRWPTLKYWEYLKLLRILSIFVYCHIFADVFILNDMMTSHIAFKMTSMKNRLNIDGILFGW